MPSVIEVLKDNHREVEQLFANFERDPQPSTAAKVCGALEMHTGAEERLVYPALREDVSGGDQLADEAEHEHADAKQLIARIRRTTDLEDLVAGMRELIQAIKHHVGEEEGTVFPKLESDLSATELDAIGANVLEFTGKR